MTPEAKPTAAARDSDGMNGFAILAILLHRRRQLFAIGGSLLALMILAYLLWPKTYTANTVLVGAATSDASLMRLAAQLPQGMSERLPGIGAGGSDGQRALTAILSSRSIADSIAARVAGQRGFEEVSEAEVRRTIRENTDVQRRQDGSYLVVVNAPEPELAVKIASLYPELANRISADLRLNATTSRLAFLEAQVSAAREKLLASEQELIRFQQKADAPDLTEQAKQTLAAAAELQREIIQQEVVVSQLRRTATPQNPELQAAQARLATLRQQLLRFTGADTNSSDLLLPLRSTPSLRIDAQRVLRDFASNERMYVSLSAELVNARLEAHNDLPVVSVLDAPALPTRHSGPSLPLFIAAALLVSACAAVAAVLMLEYLSALRGNPGAVALRSAWNNARGNRPARIAGSKS